MLRAKLQYKCLLNLVKLLIKILLLYSVTMQSFTRRNKIKIIYRSHKINIILQHPKPITINVLRDQVLACINIITFLKSLSRLLPQIMATIQIGSTLKISISEVSELISITIDNLLLILSVYTLFHTYS